MDQQMTLSQWLDAVRRQLGTDLDLSTDDQRALLDLTRVAAHRSERIAAPLTAFLAGMALTDLDPARRADEIRRITAALEETRPDTESRPAG
jgi:hypothetical protein